MTTHEQARKEPPMSDEQRMREQFEASGLTNRPLHLHGFIWEGFRGGYRSRDAEVQALREALGSIVHASNNWAMPVQAFDVTGKLADIARAALAGGEEGETDE